MSTRREPQRLGDILSGTMGLPRTSPRETDQPRIAESHNGPSCVAASIALLFAVVCFAVMAASLVFAANAIRELIAWSTGS